MPEAASPRAAHDAERERLDQPRRQDRLRHLDEELREIGLEREAELGAQRAEGDVARRELGRFARGRQPPAPFEVKPEPDPPVIARRRPRQLLRARGNAREGNAERRDDRLGARAELPVIGKAIDGERVGPKRGLPGFGPPVARISLRRKIGARHRHPVAQPGSRKLRSLGRRNAIIVPRTGILLGCARGPAPPTLCRNGKQEMVRIGARPARCESVSFDRE